MLSDRPYMRDDYPRQRTSVLAWLICGIIAGFVLQFAVDSTSNGGTSLEREFGVTVHSIATGHVWTLLTYGFLHSPTNLFHILADVLLLYFLGRELLPMLGARRFIGLYASALVAGALVWAAVHWKIGGSPLVGATAAVDALAIVYACFYPNQEFNFLLLFVFPVTLKPRHFALGLVLLDVIGLALFEIPHATLPYGLTLASSAHLGGMTLGWLYYRFVHDWPARRADVEPPRWLKRAAKATVPPAEERIELTTREDLRAEVDRILDKINSEGLGALTAEEKRVLDEAKDSMTRR